MSWFSQARIFFSEVRAMKATDKENPPEKVNKDDLEFVSSASEARLLAVPQGASFLIFLAVLATGALIAWASVMEVDEIAKAEGKVIPSKQVQVIQNLEGGIVKEINVVEGQTVQKGDVLVIIDDVYAKSDVDSNVDSYNALLARFVALNTLISGKRIITFPNELKSYIQIMSQERQRFDTEWHEITAQIKELEFLIDQRHKDYDLALNESKSQLSSANYALEELNLNRPLLKSGAISRVEFLHIEQQAAELRSKAEQAEQNVGKAKAALNEVMQKKESFFQSSIVAFEKERNEVQSKLNEMRTKGISLQAKLNHSIVTSPVVGTVKKINITTIGGVVRPGMDILEIVPTDDKLIIEVKIKPKDIGFISKNQEAIVKVTAFDYSTYGGLEGKVEFISADTITDKKGNSYYLARVRTNSNILTDKNNKKHAIIPGMKTEVRIILDKKNILTYILKPMLK